MHLFRLHKKKPVRFDFVFFKVNNIDSGAFSKPNQGIEIMPVWPLYVGVFRILKCTGIVKLPYGV